VPDGAKPRTLGYPLSEGSTMSLVVAHDDLIASNALEVTDFGSLAEALHFGP